MHTPSLRRRVVWSGVVVMAILLVAFDLVIYASLRGRLLDGLEDTLTSRLDLASTLAREHEPDELAWRLRSAGVPAVITDPDGERMVIEPAVTRGDELPAGDPSESPSWDARGARLPDGGTIEVLANTNGMRTTLRRLMLTEIIATAAVLVAAWGLLNRAVSVATRPLREMAQTARRIAAGETGQRLDPDLPETEVGQLAAAYDDMLHSLESALDRAQVSEERSRRFLQDAAHQLRTPIAALRVSIEALLMEPDPEARDRLLGNMVRETARATHVMKSLSHMARLERGRPLNTAPTDLAALCVDEAERTQSLAPQLTVSADVKSAPAERVLVDGDELREAIGNILDNARRHAESRIDLTLGQADGDLVIRVEDDGPGLPDGAEDLVFERFATLDGKGGSGLGLPIARGVARSHGGALTYEDGAFVLRLPLVLVPGDV